MAQFCKLSDENSELVRKISEETGLYNFVRIEGIGKAKAKEVIKIQRETPVAEYKTNKPDTVNVFIYERAFDMLEDQQKEMLLMDAFNQIQYDSDKDKINIGCPQIVVSVDGRAKFGDLLINTAEAAVLAIQQIEEQEREEKERIKDEKLRKERTRNNNGRHSTILR